MPTPPAAAKTAGDGASLAAGARITTIGGSTSSSGGGYDPGDSSEVAANVQQVGFDPFASSQQQQLEQQRKQGRVTRPPRSWQQKFPFAQCVNSTLTFDVSFIGAVQYAQVGE
jgi:hypothetical protein